MTHLEALEQVLNRVDGSSASLDRASRALWDTRFRKHDKAAARRARLERDATREQHAACVAAALRVARQLVDHAKAGGIT